MKALTRNGAPIDDSGDDDLPPQIGPLDASRMELLEASWRKMPLLEIPETPYLRCLIRYWYLFMPLMLLISWPFILVEKFRAFLTAQAQHES